MKHTKIAKRALACGLAVAMVVTSGNYSTVNVSAKKTKAKKAKAKKSKAKKSKAKLSKTKASVIAGQTVTLKVKKADKKVKWSVKNKKIAKIKKTSGKKKETAVISSLKKGSTVVTAKVGTKKLKCKLTVKQNNIQSVSVDKLDYSALTVKLAKKTALNVTDVKLSAKKYGDGSYNTNPKVEALSTTDQKTYRLYLTSPVSLNGYVKIQIGKFTKEAQNKQAFKVVKEQQTCIYEKDTTVDKRLDQYFRQAVGNISYSLKSGSKLPKGLSLVGKRGILKGIPSEAGQTETTIEAKDEAGRKASLKITFKVYDESAIAVEDRLDEEIVLDDYMVSLNASKLATAAPTEVPTATPVASDETDDSNIPAPVVSAAPSVAPSVNPEVTPNPEKIYTTYEISPVGGSGSYKYDLVQTGTDVGVSLSTDVTDSNNQVTKKAAASTKIFIPYGLSAGEHTYSITVTDAADATRTTTATVKVNVKERFNISGTIKDSMENALSGNEKLYFYPADAVNGADYITGYTYLKSVEKLLKNGRYTTELVGGNHWRGYDTLGEPSYKDCANGDSYVLYKHSSTSMVGPLPTAVVLTASPSPVPSAAAETTPNPAASPQATAFSVAPVEAGNYVAEVPAGKYTVKVLANNGVKYQLTDTVDITADAVGAANLTLPIRFANIKAVAKYANDKPVANSAVRFETDNKQYEGCSFVARTNYLGEFTASLPAGTYKMYWIDENSQRQYFANPVTVQDGTNAEIGDQKLAVSRYEVNGSLKVRSIGEDGNPVEAMEGGAVLRFYDVNGNVKSVYTKYDSKYDVKQEKTVDGPDHGKFVRPLLLDNGTYVVRYSDDSNDPSELRTIGTVTVNGADIAQDFVYDDTTDGMKNEFANAQMLTLEQESVFTSTGNNDILVKFAIPETAGQTSVNYDMSLFMNENEKMPNSVEIYKEPADGKSEYTSVGDVRGKVVKSFSTGTYVMRITPISYDDFSQLKGNVNIKISKHLEAYEKNSTALQLNTAATITCAKNVQDKDLQNKAYVKIPVESGKTYVLSYASKTVAPGDINISCANNLMIYTDTWNNDTSKTKWEYNADDDDDYDGNMYYTGVADGCGKVTFEAAASGDVYILFSTPSVLSSTIDVSVTVK